MINLGFNSGRNMPNVYLELAPIDRILEGLSILLTVAAWVLGIVFYYELTSPSGELFITPIAMTIFVILFLLASRAPIRFYNFPVKLNERNYVMQYFIATRFTRVVGLIGCLIIFFGLFTKLEPMIGVTPGLFLICMYGVAILLLLSFLVYYYFALRYR